MLELLFLLLLEKLSFLIYKSEGLDFILISLQFSIFLLFLIDVLVEAEKYKELLLQTIQQFHYVLTVVQLIHINLHSLERGVHCELQFLTHWQFALESIGKQIDARELALAIFAPCLLLLKLNWNLAFFDVFAD